MAWCAQFFDRQGLALRHLSRPVVQARYSDPRPLLRLRRSLNGRVFGPYFEQGDDGPEAYWIWQASGETAQAAALVLSRLLHRRREELQTLL